MSLLPGERQFLRELAHEVRRALEMPGGQVRAEFVIRTLCAGFRNEDFFNSSLELKEPAADLQAFEGSDAIHAEVDRLKSAAFSLILLATQHAEVGDHAQADELRAQGRRLQAALEKLRDMIGEMGADYSAPASETL